MGQADPQLSLFCSRRFNHFFLEFGIPIRARLARALKEKTRKFKQWAALEESIKGILPLNNSRITRYELFYDRESDFNKAPNLNILVSTIEEARSI